MIFVHVCIRMQKVQAEEVEHAEEVCVCLCVCAIFVHVCIRMYVRLTERLSGSSMLRRCVFV